MPTSTRRHAKAGRTVTQSRRLACTTSILSSHLEYTLLHFIVSRQMYSVSVPQSNRSKECCTRPQKDLHACQSSLSVVLEAQISTVFATKCNVDSLEAAEIDSILKKKIPASAKGKMDCLENLAQKVVDVIVLDPTNKLTTPHDGNDIGSYLSKCLGMGLLAWDLEDAIREGDGARIIRLWKFLLLQFKQAGRTKYSLEALRLLCDVNIALSEKQAHNLTWNRTCNLHGRAGGNKPLDLQMEHMNRTFKDNISTFAPHLSQTSVQKTAHAAPIVEEYISNFDQHLDIRQDSGYHVIPTHEKDRHMIFQELLKTKASEHIPQRAYTHFKSCSSHLYNEIRQTRKWTEFTK